MQDHILAALRELFDNWESLLASLSEAQITTPLLPSPWSTKDVVAHLWAWQQRSIAQLEAAMVEHAPEAPGWFPRIDPHLEGATDQINPQIYALYRDSPWAAVHQSWREGYLHMLELGASFAEKDLLDASRYPWLEGHSLAFVLVSTYDHHQEHYEKLIARLQEA